MRTDTFQLPSKKSVRKAGISLRDGVDDEKTRKIISEWRSAHSYPINTIQALIRKKIREGKFSSTLIAQRLKRLASIQTKLQRFSDMCLDRMQDLGGIRVIFPDMVDLRRFYSLLQRSNVKHQFVEPPHDYIACPKKDGYRSFHQVIKYESKRFPNLNGLCIELQLRTKLQHAWATAVETLGIIENTSFKTGCGSVEYKRFFKLCSALFSIEEKEPILEEYRNFDKETIVNEFKSLDAKLNVLSKLDNIVVASKNIEGNTKFEKGGYQVLVTDAQQKVVSLVQFTKNQLNEAQLYYSAQERETKDQSEKSVVMISVSSLHDLKQAYPNYFLDTKYFLEKLKKYR